MKLTLLFLFVLCFESLNSIVQECIEYISKLEEKIKYLEQEIEYLKNNKMVKQPDFDVSELESEIIDKKDYLWLLYNRLESNLYIKNRKFHLKKIYSSNRDGKYLKDFYAKVDKQKMILIIIENIDGIKFGIFIQEFTTLAKEDRSRKFLFSHFLYNTEDFIFSLDDMKIYNAHFHHEMSDPSDGFDFGHYESYPDEFHIYEVCEFREKDNKSYLDYLYFLGFFSYSNRIWEGKLSLTNKNIESFSSAKVVEAFQVVFHK